MAFSATVSLSSSTSITLNGVSPFKLTIDPKNIVVPNKIYRIDYDFGDGTTDSQTLYGPENITAFEANDPRNFIKAHSYSLTQDYEKIINIYVKVYQFNRTSPTIFNIILNLTVPTLEGLDGGFFENVNLISTRMFGPNNNLIYIFESKNPYYIIPVMVNWSSRPVEPVPPFIDISYRPYKLLAPFENEESTSIGTGGRIQIVTDTPAPPGVTDRGEY